jgi:fatty acid synthase subunit alpha
MQRAVERDEQSCSNYAMCTVSRVSKTFDDAALREVVDTMLRDCLLEIVNVDVRRVVRGTAVY